MAFPELGQQALWCWVTRGYRQWRFTSQSRREGALHTGEGTGGSQQGQGGASQTQWVRTMGKGGLQDWGVGYPRC